MPSPRNNFGKHLIFFAKGVKLTAHRKKQKMERFTENIDRDPSNDDYWAERAKKRMKNIDRDQSSDDKGDEQLRNGVMKRYSEEEISSDDGGKRDRQRIELSFGTPNQKTIIIARCEIADKLNNGNLNEKVSNPRIEFDWVRELEFGEGKGAKILPPYIASYLFEFAQGASPERLIKELERAREMYDFGLEQDAKIYNTFGGEEGWFRAKTDEALKDQGMQIGKIKIASSSDAERRAEIENLLRLRRLVAMETVNADFFNLYDAPYGEFKAVQFAHALVSTNARPKAIDLWKEHVAKKEKASNKIQQPGNWPTASA